MIIISSPKSQNASGILYILKKITWVLVKLGLRDYFARFMSLLFYLFLKIRNNLKVYGLHNIPKKEPFILAMTHSSAADALLITSTFYGLAGRKCRYIVDSRDFAKDNFARYFHHLFSGKGRKGTGNDIVKWFSGQILKGNNIVITPEGMFNRNGKIMKGFTGVTRIYHKVNPNGIKRVPIVPMITIGAHHAWPPFPGEDGKYHFKNSGIIVRYGKPFYLENVGEDKREVIHRQTDEIMDKLAHLALQKEGAVQSWILAERTRDKPRNYDF